MILILYHNKLGSYIQRTYTWNLPDSIENIFLDPNNIEIVVFVTENNQEIITGTGNIPSNNASSNGSNNSVS